MSTTNAQFFVIVLLIAFIAWREHVHSRTQRDLLNRLMSRDLTDYNVASGVVKPLANVRNPMAERARKLERQRTEGYNPLSK